MGSVIAAAAVRTGLVIVGTWVLGKLHDALDSAGALGGKNRESVVRRIEGQKVNVRSTQAVLPVVYGIQRVGLVVNDVRNASSPGTFFSGATGKDVLVKSGAIAIGSEDGSGIQAVANVRVYDDGDYAITSPASFPSSAVNTNVALPYTNYLKYIIQDGDDAQTLPSDLGTAMGWTSDYKGRGVAYAAFLCLYNENVWKRGVPQITMDVTGNRVYDPRTSSWIGYNASGASSDNPALCILDYLTSKRYGAGIPYAARDGGALDFIDEQSFEDAADYCDVLVNTYSAGPQEKRFRMNAVVDTSRVVSANLVEMLATCRGQLVWQNGKYKLIIRQAQTAQSFELTEDNIVGSLDWRRQGTSVPNLIEATFPNGSGDDYVADSVQFPPVGTTTYLDEDNGVENRLEIALPYTTGIYQAQRTVETMLKELRADVYVSLTATQAAYTLQVGDVVNVTHSGPKWTQKAFVVRTVALTADGLVGLGLQEYDSSAYTVTAPDQEDSDDAIDLPDPQRAYTTITMSGDRFVSQGATTSGGVAAQQWERRIQFRAGINTRSVTIVYDFDRPDIPGGATSTNYSRNYTLDVTPDSHVTHVLEDGAGSDQIFLARDDNGTTRYDEAISVTITPNDTAAAAGQDGTAITTQVLDLALEDDVGFRVDAEVQVVDASYAVTNGDAWLSFTTSIAYFAQGFTMPAGTDRDLASVEVYLRRVGSPTGSVNLYVYSNNATPSPDEPNASIAASTTSTTASSLSASGEAVRLDMDRVSLTAGGSYWVVVEHVDSSGTDYVEIRVDESSPNGSNMTDTATSPEVVSWTVTSASTRQAAGFYLRRFGTQVVPTRQLGPASDKSAVFTWQSDGTVALASDAAASGAATTLAGLTDTNITSPSTGDLLRYSTSKWVNTTLVAGDIPNLDTSKITSGTFADARIPNLDTSKITSGTFATARIPDLDAAKITTGTFATARIPDLDAAKITSGTFADARISESNVTQHEAALSVLGIEALSDPNADRIFFWDDSAGAGGAFAFLEVAGGLEIPVAAPTTIQVDVGDGIALSGGEVVFDASVLNDEDVAMVAGDRFVVWDSGEAGTGSRQMNPSRIPLSLFNDDLGFSQNVEGAGITLSTTTGTNDTIALDYLGPDSFIAEAPAGSIVSSDEILFMDVNDSSNVKRDLVSSLPFAPSSHTHPASDITAGTFGAGAYTFTRATADTTPTVRIENTSGTTGRVLLTLDGESDELRFENYDTGDWQIVNSQQTNGIRIKDGSGGITFLYSNAEVVAIDSSGGLDTLSGGILTGGTQRIEQDGDLVNIKDITASGAFTTTGVGPHGIGSSGANNIQLKIDGSFTSTSGSSATGIRYNSNITGASGNTTRLTHFDMSSATITTQSVNEDITNIASFLIQEPDITNNLFDSGNGRAINTVSNGTVTTTGAHGFLTGEIVHINGSTDSNHNGWWTVTNTGTNTFTLDEYTGTSSGTGGDAYDASKIARASTLWVNNQPTAGTATGIDEAWGIYAPVSARLGAVTAGLIEPISDSTYALGTAINRWSTVYADSIDVSTFLADDGTQSAPSYAFSDDTNTGMWSPAADTIAFSTSGQERLRITSSGNVDFTGAVDIDGVTTVGGNILPDANETIDIGATGTRFNDIWASYLYLKRLNAAPHIDAIREDATISSGTVLLDIYGQGDLGSGAATGAMIRFISDETWVQGTDSGTHIRFSTTDNDDWDNPQERMRLDHNGRLGIGELSPESMIHTKTDANRVATFESTDNEAYIRIQDLTDSTYVSADAGVASIGANVGADADNLNVVTLTSGGLTEGHVGIGTASPYSALDLGPHGNPLSMISWHVNSTTSYAHIWASTSGARLTLGHGVMGSDTVANGFEYSTSNTWARSAIELSYGQINFFCNPADSGTYGSAVAMDNRMYLSTTGFKVDVGSDHFQIVRDSASTAQLELNNTNGDRGYLQATNAGAVTLATQVAGGQISLRDNANSLNLIQADYNGTDTVRVNSNGNNSFAINATGGATSATMRWRFGGTDEARIQWLDSSNELRVRLEDSTDRYSIFIGGASGVNDRRFDIKGIADNKGVVAVENAQLYVDEYGTQYEDTGTVTIDWDKGNQQLIDFDSTSTTTTIDINDAFMEAGGSYILLLQYNSGSSQTVAWTSSTPLLWANGDEPTSTYTAGTAGDITVVQFFKTTVATDKIIGSYYIVT